MKKILTWFVATLAFMTIFNCTDDRIINNGDSMLVVRTKINQNFSDLYDSVQHHTDLIQVIDYIGTQDSIDDHRTAINALVVADGAMDTRVDALELIDHTHSNSSILNATTASFTTTLKTLYDGYNTSIGNLDDSISDHRTDINLNVYNIDFLADFIQGDLADTIVDHRTDINYALNNLGGGTGTGDVKVNGTTAANDIAYWNGTDSTLVSNDAIKIYADSAVFTEELKAYDSIRFMYIQPVLSGTRFIVLTSGAAGDSGVLHPASKQLVNKLLIFPKYFFDRKNGELVYQYTKNDRLISNYGTARNDKTGESFGLESIEMLTGAYEKSVRFIWRQWLENKLQWLIIILIGIIVIRQQRQIKILKKK